MTTEEAYPRVRVAAIITRGNRVLLVCHEKHGRAYWLLPGGGVECGETLHGALTREVREEAGLTIAPGDLVLANDTIAPDGSRHVVNLYFLAEAVDGELRPGRDGRLVDAAYVALKDVASLDLRPDIRQELLAVVRGSREAHPSYLGPRWQDV